MKDKTKKKSYVCSKELRAEILKSFEQDSLTPRALELLMRMSYEAIKLKRFKDDEDRKDCIAQANSDLVMYWRSYNPEYPNIFAYYRQIIENGYRKAWNKLHPLKSAEQISLNNCFNL